MGKLINKLAVITGGTSGIGLAAAHLFAKNGAQVIVTGRDPVKLESVVKEIGNGAVGYVTDISNIEEIDELYNKIDNSFGKIDVLVANAGIYINQPAVEFTEEMFDQISDTNFKGTFFTIQKALPYLNDGASVILTSSTSGHKGFARIAVYGATKAAVRSLARTFSAEFLSRKIRFNVVSPGPIDTPAFERSAMSLEQIASIKSSLSAAIPINRLGTSEEVAEALLYLASEDSRFILGGELLIDGGRVNL